MPKTSRRWEWMVGLAALTVELAPLFCAHEAFAVTRSPEQDTLETARHLKPISDEEWKAIAGEHITEKYQIIRGDTLSGISKRLFGDPKYWPKLFALNNDSISNPHLIRPGNAVIFQFGTGTSLPQIGISVGSPAQGTASDAPSAGAMSSTGNEEWRRLPKQSWEFASRVLPANVDAMGFEKRKKLSFGQAKGQELESLATSEKLSTLGKITGSRSEASHLSTGDILYIRSTQIQVGETYAVTHEPAVIKARKSDRKGNAYPLLGRVKIIGVRENLFIGTIISAQSVIARGDELITDPGRPSDLTPIPAPAGIEGVVIMNKELSTHLGAQHKQVFINRGTADGIQPGMVFRAYEHYDPSNEKKITNSDFIIDADMMVVHATEHFCSALVIRSLSAFADGSAVSALTDVSSLINQRSLRYKDLDYSNDKPAKPSELDELDQLDSSGDLGRDERLELNQLENWKGNPEPTPEPNSEASPLPDKSPAPEVTPLMETMDEPTPEPASEALPPEMPMADTPPAPPSEFPGDAPADVPNIAPTDAPVEAPLTTPEPIPSE